MSCIIENDNIQESETSSKTSSENVNNQKFCVPTVTNHNIVNGLTIVLVSVHNESKHIAEDENRISRILKKMHNVMVLRTDYGFLPQFQHCDKFTQLVIDGDTIVFFNNPLILSPTNTKFESIYKEAAKSIIQTYGSFTMQFLFVMLYNESHQAPKNESRFDFDNDVKTICESPEILQTSVYSNKEFISLITDWYIPKIYNFKQKNYEGDLMYVWKNRENLKYFLSSSYEISNKSKSAIPLNVIGKYYFIEALNSIQTDHYDRFTIDLFSNLCGFIDEQVLSPVIDIANKICYKIDSPAQKTRFLSMDSISTYKNSAMHSEVSVPLRKVIGNDMISNTISERSSENEDSSDFNEKKTPKRNNFDQSSFTSEPSEELEIHQTTHKMKNKDMRAENPKISFKQLENNFSKKNIYKNIEKCYKQDPLTQGYQKNHTQNETNIRVNKHPEVKDTKPNFSSTLSSSKSSEEAKCKNQLTQRPRMNFDMLKKLNNHRYK